MRELPMIIATFAVYSCSSMFTKLASNHSFLSVNYIVFMALAVGVLCVYAVMWQKVLARMPLNKAFPYKSMSIIFVLAISCLIFGEQITINNMIGIALIAAGLVVMSLKEQTE